jgi:hypothetical protein
VSYKLTVLLITFFVSFTNAFCQNSKELIKKKEMKNLATDSLFKQILRLDEFKNEENRVDSIKRATAIAINLHIDIVDSSFLEEDNGKNISLAFINEDYPYDHNRTVYTIKFDKDRLKIISIDKDKKQFEQSDFEMPKDIPLLPNH